jgi:hypothetical protein
VCYKQNYFQNVKKKIPDPSHTLVGSDETIPEVLKPDLQSSALLLLATLYFYFEFPTH